MAFAHQAFFGLISMRDQGMNQTRMRIEINAPLGTIAQAGTNLAGYVSLLAAVTDCWIESYTLEDKWVTDVLFTAAEPHGEAATKALLSVQLTTPGKTGIIEVPAPKDAIFVAASGAGYNVVDTLNTAITAFVEAYESGQKAFLSDGELSIDGGLLKGVRTHHKSRDA
jgi:hypothetical protein